MATLIINCNIHTAIYNLAIEQGVWSGVSLSLSQEYISTSQHYP